MGFFGRRAREGDEAPERATHCPHRFRIDERAKEGLTCQLCGQSHSPVEGVNGGRYGATVTATSSRRAAEGA